MEKKLWTTNEAHKCQTILIKYYDHVDTTRYLPLVGAITFQITGVELIKCDYVIPVCR